MGSEQSSQQSKAVRAGLRRGKSVPEYHADFNENNDDNDNECSATISPEPSVCSDSDLPYISYTVNRPIGDSPKKKPFRRLSRGKSSSSSASKKNKKRSQISTSSTHNIVVVKEAVAQPSKSSDPDLLKLQSIPMFLPIMRATLNAPAARDPEVLERLNSTPLCNLCHIYQNCLHSYAVEIANEQDKITKQISVVDKKASKIMNSFDEHRKTLATCAEKFNKINDIIQMVDKYNSILKETIELIQVANDALPEDLRLEPFEWTTG